MRKIVPLRKRRVDIAILGFFIINILFITYIIDLEQLVIADTARFSYPLWPLPLMIDMVHWWGRNFDPLLMARPVWWRATIWIDALLFGPFYCAAIYAFIKGKDWIRLPAVIYSSVLITNVTIIMSEEMFGVHASQHPGMVWLVNLPWIIFPLLIIIRMWRSGHPFTESE